MHTEQKAWSNWSLRQQNYLNYPTFTEYFVITWLFSAHVLLWGPLFVGAPVRPNMLNMPKPASGCIRIPLGTEVGLGPGDIVLDGDPAPPRKGKHQPPLFGQCLLWPNGRPSQQLLSCCSIWRVCAAPFWVTALDLRGDLWH